MTPPSLTLQVQEEWTECLQEMHQATQEVCHQVKLHPEICHPVKHQATQEVHHQAMQVEKWVHPTAQTILPTILQKTILHHLTAMTPGLNMMKKQNL